MAEPKQNSYTITVHLFDVKKQDAVALAERINNSVRAEKISGEVMVVTSHVKDVSE